MKVLAMALMVGALNLPALAQEEKYESFPVVEGEYEEVSVDGNHSDFALWSTEAEEGE